MVDSKENYKLDRGVKGVKTVNLLSICTMDQLEGQNIV